MIVSECPMETVLLEGKSCQLAGVSPASEKSSLYVSRISQRLTIIKITYNVRLRYLLLFAWDTSKFNTKLFVIHWVRNIARPIKLGLRALHIEPPIQNHVPVAYFH